MVNSQHISPWPPEMEATPRPLETVLDKLIGRVAFACQCARITPECRDLINDKSLLFLHSSVLPLRSPGAQHPPDLPKFRLAAAS